MKHNLRQMYFHTQRHLPLKRDFIMLFVSLWDKRVLKTPFLLLPSLLPSLRRVNGTTSFIAFQTSSRPFFPLCRGKPIVFGPCVACGPQGRIKVLSPDMVGAGEKERQNDSASWGLLTGDLLLQHKSSRPLRPQSLICTDPNRTGSTTCLF